MSQDLDSVGTMAENINKIMLSTGAVGWMGGLGKGRPRMVERMEGWVGKGRPRMVERMDGSVGSRGDRGGWMNGHEKV